MKARGVSQAELARRVGISQPSIYKLIKGQSARSSHLHLIARALSTTPEYLTGETDEKVSFASERLEYHADSGPESAVPTIDAVILPEIDIGFSMGGGMVIADHAAERLVPFPKEWLRSKIRGNFNQLFIARGEGDSMHPTILDGDIVIVDTSQQSIHRQDDLWCLAYGELGMIKRVLARHDGSLEIKSDNPAAGNFTAHDGEVQIIGRVVFTGRAR